MKDSQFRQSLPRFLAVLFFTAVAFLVMGYHPGFEDDGIYLSAIKAELHPAWFPYNSGFFRLQMQATLFDRLMADFVSWTGIPLPWAELFWQLASLYLILWASYRIARQLFASVHARWAAVAMVAAMLTLPVAGTALYVADQHLHPRNMATALIALAVAYLLEEKRWQALPLLILAFVLHPIMAAMGASFAFFLALVLYQPAPAWARAMQESLLGAAPLGWVLGSPSPAWRQALDSRAYFLLSRWQWYEWLGALGPLVLFWLLWRAARKHGETRLAQFALAVLAYGVFQQIVAMVMLTPSSLLRLAPLQPMRYLQLIYLFMILVAGGLLGRFALNASRWRWAAYLLLFNGSMFLVQWQCIDEGTHLEMPWTRSANPWLQAFEWVRHNTPADAYFALDPQYLAAPGEGFHSFRALAERSQFSDGIKDTAVAIVVPSLAPEWAEQQSALAGWSRFQLRDFERLKRDFGVTWIVASTSAPPAGLGCAWHNEAVSVCRIP